MGAFGTVLIVVCVVAILVAAASYWGSGKIYSTLGRSGPLSVGEDDLRRAPAALAAPAPTVDESLQEEVRQLVEARNERLERQGKPPLDVKQEVERQLRELGA